MTYSKRYAGGFVDSPLTASPIDSTFLNAVETALVALFGITPTTNGALIWNGSAFTAANLIANAQIDPAAAIAKTKLAALNIGNSDVAGAAAIARSKLDFGSGLVNADVATTAALAGSKLNLIPATTLNASPTNGEVGVLTDSTSAPTYVWAFVWNASAAKWVFIGGSPAHSENTTNDTTSSGSYVDFAQPVSFTVPRAGTYTVMAAANINSGGTGTALVSLKRGTTATSDTDAFINNGVPGEPNGFRTYKVTGLAASDVLKLQWRYSLVSGSLASKWRSIDVWPVTVT